MGFNLEDFVAPAEYNHIYSGWSLTKENRRQYIGKNTVLEGDILKSTIRKLGAAYGLE